MSIEDIFRQRRKRWDFLIHKRRETEKMEITCPTCKKAIPEKELLDKKWICPGCNTYLQIPPMKRVALVCDENSFRELDANLKSNNPIQFPGYADKLKRMQEKTGAQDAFLSGRGKIKGIRVAIGVLDSRFFMGSMGTVVGEKITRLAEYAEKKKLPLILFSVSGGARMQEGLFSLMQMAKTSAAIERYKQSGGLFISYLTNPTTGGVSASFASLGDLMIAEPGALIGFAGPRVIEQTIGQKLPPAFQHAEFLLEHGMIDLIVERRKMRQTLYQILKMHQYEKE